MDRAENQHTWCYLINKAINLDKGHCHASDGVTYLFMVTILVAQLCSSLVVVAISENSRPESVSLM